MNGPVAWAGFLALVVLLLALDLFVFNRKAHEIHIKEAILFSLFWIGVALAFNLGILLFEGRKRAMEFLAGYLIEKSLSVDNLFVFIVIFAHYRVEPKFQHKILFWGIVGALVMRAVFIVAGVAIIQKFVWTTYVLGLFLVYTGVKILFSGEVEIKPSQSPILRLAHKILPMTDKPDGGRFFVKHGERWMVTPLFIVLLIIETTDVVFAVDSIPAVLAISHDPFIVFSSNVFAILGLRALYFALAGVMRMFRYLKVGLAVVLAFVGIKMIVSHFYKLPIELALGVVIGVLGLSVAASLLFPGPRRADPFK